MDGIVGGSGVGFVVGGCFVFLLVSVWERRFGVGRSGVGR